MNRIFAVYLKYESNDSYLYCIRANDRAHAYRKAVKMSPEDEELIYEYEITELIEDIK